MKTYSTQIVIGAEHLDGGDHANWHVQLAMAEKIHFTLRKQLGLGLKELKETHGLFLVMGSQSSTYRKQLRSGDIVDVHITMWVSRLTCLEFECIFCKDDGKVATEMSWVMPLVSFETERLRKIPEWMIEVIGSEKPSLQNPPPATIS